MKEERLEKHGMLLLLSLRQVSICAKSSSSSSSKTQFSYPMSSSGPAGSSQGLPEDDVPLTDAECVAQCNQAIESFKRGDQSNNDTILSIRNILLRSASNKAGKNLGDALLVYLDVVEEACRSKEHAVQRENVSGSAMSPESRTISVLNQDATSTNTTQEIRDDEGSESERSEKSDESKPSTDEELDRPAKRRKVKLEDSQCPWHRRRPSEFAELPSAIRKTIHQLDHFALDPKAVVQDILSTPSCPLFPLAQWLNLVQWKYINLAKVLEVAHTTDLDPKQTHIIDDEVELSYRVSQSNKFIRNAADHNTVFSIFVEALGFVFPQWRKEFTRYQTSANCPKV